MCMHIQKLQKNNVYLIMYINDSYLVLRKTYFIHRDGHRTQETKYDIMNL